LRNGVLSVYPFVQRLDDHDHHHDHHHDDHDHHHLMVSLAAPA